MKTRTDPAAAATSSHLLVLDGYRGLAAVAVVLFHMRTTMGAPAPASAYLAVDLFFALSGYVIAHAYDSRNLAPSHFALLRIVRLYPLYLAGTALTMSAAFAVTFVAHDAGYWTPSHLLQAAVVALVMLPSTATGNLFQFNMPAWSLFFEMLANLAYGLRLRLGASAIACMIACAVGLVIEVFRHGGLDHGATWEWSWCETLGFGILRVGFSFSLGLLLQRRLRDVRLPSLPAPLLLMLLALALCAAPPASLRVFYELAFVALLSPTLILLGARAHPGLMRLCAFLGFTSYPLYALHNPILDLSNGAMRRLHLSAPLPLLVIIGMVAALILIAWVAGHADAAIRKRLLSRLGLAQRAPYRLMQAT